MNSESFKQEKLCDVLTQLMSECDIDDLSLSKQTSIPLSTIARLRTNQDSNPTAQTLRPLAHFFDVTIGQLLGDEPISKDRIPGTFNHKEYTMSLIPIIEWDSVKEVHEKETLYSKALDWISTEKQISENSFALIIKTDSLGLAFRKGSIIIIDQKRKVEDSDLVLIKLAEENEIVLKQIIRDGNDLYIRSLNPELGKVKLLKPGYEIYGIVIECRISTNSIVQKKYSSTQSLIPNFKFNVVKV